MSEIQTLARGLQIIDQLEASAAGMSVTSIAEMFGVDKSSASRFIKTLVSYGYAEQDPATRLYKLGPRLVSLGQSVLNKISFRDQARPFLRQLVAQTGECAHLAKLANGGALYIDQVDTPASLRVSTDVGTLGPLHCTALGKVLLAFAEVPIPGELKGFTARTIVTQDSLRSHLEQVRQLGYAIDDEEYNVGVRCVAAPVYDVNGDLAGAIGISGPTGRVTLERIPEFAEIVKRISEALTRQLRFERK
ncbi:MAG: IclR family transcriptional regulator [Trueperaceae bacterium]|nr:MAG: IclR family transcriptional regulator [Trueperaceae bacterium]